MEYVEWWSVGVRGDSGYGRCRVRIDGGVNFKDWVVGVAADQ